MTAAATDAPPLVVHIIYALGTGGLENGLVNLINRCPPNLYRHAIICLTGASEFARRLEAPDVEIVELHKRPGNDPVLFWKLWRELRRLRPAIVHTRNLAALETQVLGLIMPRCRRVHGEHGRDMHDLDGSNTSYRLLRRALAPLIHRFITVSRDLSTWLVEEVGIARSKVTQVYNGVDQERFSPPPSPGQRSLPDAPPGFLPQPGGLLVGTVGRLAEVKNQVLLLDALSHLFREQPHWRTRLRLIIVGEGPARRELEEKILAHDLDNYVWLTGDRNDVPALMQQLDIFVLPSLGEGISNTVLEAMATGLPVIATEVGGNPELVTHGRSGLLVPPGDARALAGAIASLVGNPVRRWAMGEAGLRRVRRDFHWQETVHQYLRLYNELLGRPGLQPGWA